MFLPLGTDRPRRRPTVVTHALILANVGVFLAQLLAQRAEAEGALGAFVLDPGRPAAAWTFLTYAFLHANFLHIAGNMLFLWVFGPNVEDRLGRAWFLVFYLAAAAGSGAAHALLETDPVVGASGAIAGVTGAYLVLFPRTRVKVLILFFVIGVFMIPAAWFIGFRIFWDIMLTGLDRSGNIATIAHLGGYAFGFAVAWALLASGVLGREPYDLFSIARHARRKRAFQEMGDRRERHIKRRPIHAKADALDTDADRIAAARALISSKMAQKDMDGAAEAYRKLLSAHGSESPASLLSRRQLYDLANHLFAAGDYQTAATAYERFLDGYPHDPEAGHVMVLLGRINARYLNDPVRAKQVLNSAIQKLNDAAAIDIARRELEALG